MPNTILSIIMPSKTPLASSMKLSYVLDSQQIPPYITYSPLPFNSLSYSSCIDDVSNININMETSSIFPFPLNTLLH